MDVYPERNQATPHAEGYCRKSKNKRHRRQGCKEKAELPPRLIIKTVASLHRKSIYDKDDCHHLINCREAWQVVVGYTGREVYYPE